MTCTIKTLDHPTSCQSSNNTIHPPKSREEGNPNRLTHEIHTVRRETAGQYGTTQTVATLYCGQCCPVCATPAPAPATTKENE